ncbi:hypothetical protein [Argonema galeatum]|uniref:hypothetical protein n=1 Tax=Argonema galeatum TaxID=2942762 RepID=UPI0020116501|nr:hypothetical protein [Argonema galeatum]MCL1468955.1 hypothetical protein [Argonema galeatum A003/A1]
MTSKQSNNSNTVEVDGIQFETLMPERVFVIPASQQDVSIPVQLGIRITNNTPTAVRFCFYSAMTPELMMPDGQIRRQGSYFSDWLEGPRASDFPTVLPGEAVTFFPSASYRYEGNQFQFTISVGNGGYWVFEKLQLGSYQIRFNYKNNAAQVRAYDLESGRNKLIENIWTGVVLMPFIEFSVLNP